MTKCMKKSYALIKSPNQTHSTLKTWLNIRKVAALVNRNSYMLCYILNYLEEIPVFYVAYDNLGYFESSGLHSTDQSITAT